ncbi:MAG TPA: copper chaperone PCu(A)C [Devosia sp.]|jgi:hypothetical protein|nr:copper chaperone PCu(A)C [Devosia sp.]
MTVLRFAAPAAFLLAAVPTAALAASGIVAGCPAGQSFSAGPITVSGAFLRATPKGAQSAGGYLTISNTGASADIFTGASSPAADSVELHQMKMNGNVMEMSDVSGGLPIPPGGSLRLDPFGYHLMLTGMAAPFVQGDCVAMTLHFATAGDIPVEFNVGSMGQATAPAASGGVSVMPSGGMDMSSMSMGM